MEKQKSVLGWDFKNEKVEESDAIYEKVFGRVARKPFDWRPHLPDPENQRRTVFCLIFSYLNCLETMAKKAKIDINFAELWVAANMLIKGLIGRNGTTFNKVAQMARDVGIIKEEFFPLKDEWLENPWRYTNEMKTIPESAKTAKKFDAPNYSWVGTGLSSLKNALADTPIWCGIGVGAGYENEVVYKPRSYSSYHAVTLAYADDYKYIFDSVGRPLKKLSLNYPILYAKSLKKLPENWKELMNLPLELVKKKNENEVFCIIGGKRFWVTPWAILARLHSWGIINKNEIQEVDVFTESLGGVFGELTISGYLNKKLGKIK